MTRAINIEIPFTAPMECLAVNRLPEGTEWVYELKLDGYRAQAIRDKNGVRLYSRNGKDFSRKFPQVFSALKDALPMGTALDGELVAFDAVGHLSFDVLQNAGPDANVVFFAFDVLESDGKDVKKLPLRARKAILKLVLDAGDRIQCSEHFAGPLAKFTEAVKEIGAEGIVAKRLDAPYESDRRSGSWSKMRLNIGQEFVIGGFTPGPHGVDALIVGCYEGKLLKYVARVRAGFAPASRSAVHALLKPLVTNTCPFKNLPEARSGRWGEGLTAAKMKECVWVKPQLVANFEFLEWTDTNHVRHIKFVGMRDDKDPRSVVRERDS